MHLYRTPNGQSWSYTTLANGANWIDVASQDNPMDCYSSGSATETTISTNQGGSWSAGTTISGQNKLIEYGNGIFVILPESGNTALTSLQMELLGPKNIASNIKLARHEVC